uniref:Secretin/TonB short N-terminal domain-containing protein n=1 Tax=Schlesneria paludicola TaxID=360056 RepID=A0A7C2PHW7_9PLAN
MFATVRWSFSTGFVVGLLSSSLVVADDPATLTGRAAPVRAKTVNTVEDALAQRAELAFSDTPLSDALRFVAKSQGINIVVDNIALERAGITGNVPISVDVSGVTLRSALKTILEPRGLVAVAEDDVLKITTPQRAQPAAAQRPVYFPTPAANEIRIRDSLSEPTQPAFADTPLADAVDFLRDYHQINIWIDRTALQDEGVDPSLPINLELSGITLRSALRLMLEPYGLTAVVEDEVLKVTTRTAAQQKVVTRVYPVGDLVGSYEDLAAIQQAIQTTTGGRWRSDDAAVAGSISVVPRSASIVVKQTHAVHDEIVDLLANLRAAQELPIEPPQSSRLPGNAATNLLPTN